MGAPVPDSDHDLLIRLDEKMDAVLKALDEGNKCMDDHENRIKLLESDKDQRIGADKNVTRTAAIVSGIISGISALVVIIVQLWPGGK